MSNKDNNKSNTNKTKCKSLPKSDIVAKRKEIFDLSKPKKNNSSN